MREDKFFTKKEIVHGCLKSIDISNFDLVVEPSAGNGAFLKQLNHENVVAIDLYPEEGVDVIECDYLRYNSMPLLLYDHVLVIGNPPYGKNSSKAVKFFNKSATFCHMIAFIVPRTFRKASLQNRLNRNFHLVHDEILPPYAFVDHFNKCEYDVPTCWQIWEKNNSQREIKPRISTNDFSFVGDVSDADFLVQRVGGAAGKCHYDITKSKNSHYLIRGEEDIFDILSSINWDKDSAKYDCAGNPTISKSELIQSYNDYKKRREET